MADIEFGFFAQILAPPGAPVPRWRDVRGWLHATEAAGFDTFWVPDELVWQVKDPEKRIGWWECVAITGAAAAESSSIEIGTWVLSALHRNPGLTAKVAATLDEIAGGRFVFGFGSGHAGPQGEAFGFPHDKTVSRYEDALKIIVPLLRQGEVDYKGEYHTAVNQPLTPLGPSGTKIPLMLGGHGPRTMGLAVEYADIWSAYTTTSAYPSAFKDMTTQLDRILEESGRDPGSLGRSIGIPIAAPGVDPAGPFVDMDPIRGSLDEIVETLVSFTDLGVTRLEFVPASIDLDAWIPAMAEILQAVREA